MNFTYKDDTDAFFLVYMASMLKFTETRDVLYDEKAWVDFILNDDLPWGEIVYENEYLRRVDLLELVDTAYAQFYEGSEFAVEAMILDRFNIKKREYRFENI